jgi:integrase
MPKRLPKLCHHKPTGQAYVRIAGKAKYLGAWGSEMARERYDAEIAKLKRDDELGRFSLRVGDLALLYKKHAAEYYVRDGEPTSEQNNIAIALRPLVKRYRRLAARDFSPRCLKAVRDDMVKAGCVRTSINRQVERIKRAFKWGVSEELVPVNVYQALQTVTGLRAGRSDASEAEPVMPVQQVDIDAIKPHVPRQVWAAVQLQLLTGARPTEILMMRECDIDASGDVWAYRPQRHKTQHHGKGRTIFIGPKAQKVVSEFLKGSPTRYLFSPAEAREQFDAKRKASRKTPLTPSQRRRKRKAKPKKQPGERYTVTSYRRAIVKGCEKAEVAAWSPGRLRHNAATLLNEQFGDIDAARVVLGHSERSTTAVYAERDLSRAREIVAAIG